MLKLNVIKYKGGNIEMEKIIWGKFTPTAITPTKRIKDAGFDIYEDTLRSQGKTEYILQPFETKRFDTNIGLVIPEGYVAIAKERSSTGKLSIFVGAGVIDSNYRGGVGVFITNASGEMTKINLEKAIAQLVIHKCEHSESDEVFEGSPEEFSRAYPSDRGLGKEGSTGK